MQRVRRTLGLVGWLRRTIFGGSGGSPSGGGFFSSFGWSGLFADPASGFGVSGSESLALNFSAVWRAVSLISSSIASLPCNVFKLTYNDDQITEPANPIAALLRNPNPEMTGITFLTTIMLHLLLWGNGRAWIQRDGTGKPQALWPIHPSTCTVTRDEKNILLYTVAQPGKESKKLRSEDVLDIPFISTDGITGYSVVALASQTFAGMMAMQEFATRFYNNSAMPSGILTVPTKLEDTAHKRLRESFQSRNAGPANAGLNMILDNGMTWQAVTQNQRDSQWAETQRLSNEDVARWFGLAVYWLSEVQQGGPNVEQRGIELVTFTLRPFLVRLEQEINRKLLDAGSFSEFDTDALLRGDTATRYNAAKTALAGAPFLTPDEVRRSERYKPIEGGDKLQTISAPTAQTAQSAEPVTTPRVVTNAA